MPKSKTRRQKNVANFYPVAKQPEPKKVAKLTNVSKSKPLGEKNKVLTHGGDGRSRENGLYVGSSGKDPERIKMPGEFVSPSFTAPSFTKLRTEEDAKRVLLEFDFNHRFGPCSGISRRDRWNRAQKFNLNPPEQVLRILQKYPNLNAN
ncbi:hypothetical protein QYM36_010945 [Artemia franciscana]|nr:hypothetical protein QYM36_010945 [Artemia franciscana]